LSNQQQSNNTVYVSGPAHHPIIHHTENTHSN
jgi:hypothetical protein